MNFEPPKAEEIKAVFPQFQEVIFLNAGGFKAVYKVVENGITEAFKIVHISEVSGVDPEVGKEIRKESLGRIAREIKILNNCKSPEIVKLGSVQPAPTVITGREYVAYSEEFLDGVTLRELIKQSIKPSENALMQSNWQGTYILRSRPVIGWIQNPMIVIWRRFLKA